MQRSKRALPVVAAMSAVLIALTGCTGGGGESEDGVTTITFSGDGSETFMAAQLEVIRLFEEAHPEHQGRVRAGARCRRGGRGAILRLGQGDTSLDVVTTEVGYEYQWFKNGWLESLTPYFTQEELDQVDAHMLDNVTFEENILSVPMDNSTMYLAVNQDLLAEAGVTPPPAMKRNTLAEVTDGVWTWEAVLDAAEKVQAATGKTGILFPNDETWILAPMGQQLGGEMFLGRRPRGEGLPRSGAVDRPRHPVGQVLRGRHLGDHDPRVDERPVRRG